MFIALKPTTIQKKFSFVHVLKYNPSIVRKVLLVIKVKANYHSSYKRNMRMKAELRMNGDGCEIAFEVGIE